MQKQNEKKGTEVTCDLEVFKIVTSHFRQDLREFWNRANFYLLTNSGILSAFLIIYPTLVEAHTAIVIIVPILGLAVASFWFVVLRGAVYWIEQWREEVIRLSKEIDRFQCYARIESSVKRKRLHSPSYLTQFLPLVFIFAWFVILALVLRDAFSLVEFP